MRLCTRPITPLIAGLLLFASSAATVVAQQGHAPGPAASPAAAGSWQVTDAHPTGASGFVALSPDGRYIAGANPDNQFCVGALVTMELACDTAAQPIHLESIAWAPDSSAVAYSLDAFRRVYESDIFVFELEAGASVILTPDDVQGSLLNLDGAVVPVDVMPAWAPDSQSLTFARTAWGSAGHGGTELMTIARDGGEPEPRATISDELSFAIFTPMFNLADGTLLYAVGPVDLDAPETGIWRLDVGGETSQLMAGATGPYPVPIIADVATRDGATVISGYSIAAIGQFNTDDPVSFLLDLDSGRISPLVHPDDDQVLIGPAGFSPDGSTLIAPTLNTNGAEAVILGEETQVVPLGPVPEGQADAAIAFVPPQWAENNTVLLAGFTSTPYLLTVAPGF